MLHGIPERRARFTAGAVVCLVAATGAMPAAAPAHAAAPTHGTRPAYGALAAPGTTPALDATPALATTPLQEEFPTTAGEARRLYESRVDNWTSGPVEMLLTDEERQIWGTLEDTEQKARFIEWFWDRRDPDGRNLGNKFQEEFYENVAWSNQRYRGFPRGWKSDRGRVRCTLGRPDSIGRRTWGQLFGAGSGPDFEVFSYSNLGNNRAFQAQSGEFLVYFIETRIGNFEIYDYRWGAGVWDRNIRLAFEIVIEASIIDPVVEFEPGEARGDFVREISEGSLPVEVPVGIWADLGAGNAVSTPVQIRLGDLLFQPEGEVFVAHLDASLELQPADGSAPSKVAESWEVRLGQDDLLALGNGSFVTAMTAAARPGNTNVSLVVSHPLAATDAEWSQEVDVVAEPGASIVVGNASLSLSASDPSAVAVLMSADGVFASGGSLVVGAWMRGEPGNPEALSIQMESADGVTHVLDIEEASWLGGLAGPLLVRSRIPELEAGEYVLRVDFGVGHDAASAPVQVGG